MVEEQRDDTTGYPMPIEPHPGGGASKVQRRMKLKPYPKTKPSGVQWLGDVPEHWEVDRAKWSTIGCFNGVWGDEPNGENDVVCVRVADFDRGSLLVVDQPPTMRAVEAGQLKSRKLKRKDLLIEKSGGGEKQLVGCVVYFDHDFSAVCSNFVARMPVVSEQDARFWSYVHAALYAGRLNYPAIKQTTGIQNLDSSAYLDTPAPFPPTEEQRTIAAYLDRETGRIDELVGKKRDLIERLKEKRTALISRTVTRGLPADLPPETLAKLKAVAGQKLPLNPPLKPSGIDWLGDVPEHWDAKKLGYGAWLQGGYAFASDKFDTEGVPVIRMNNLKRGVLDTSQASCVAPEHCLDAFALEEGDLLWGMSGSIGETGSLGNFARVRQCDLPAQLNQRVGRFQVLGDEAALDFITYIIQTKFFYDQILLFVTGTAQFNVSSAQVQSAFMPFPPLPEQRAIAAYLDEETAKLDALVAKVETAIERLQEYRTALITAAVTGKIDVREEVMA